MRTLAFILLLLVFSAAPSKSYEEYWDKWHKCAEDVSKYISNKVIEDFLVKALENTGNAERNQANSNVIKGLIITNPDCFCNAFIKLPDSLQTKLKQFHLQAPLYHDREVINSALFSNKISRQCHAF